ncbi:MAG: YkgJ family cysteine cluster protein [Thermoanaerobaculia bacterium]|nr:YkgJ family cysteine cluster protein [Thermoanaerobaculia bacterium]
MSRRAAEERARPPWFAAGLRFRCTACGDCCRGEGYVWVGRREAERLAEHLDLERDEFGRRYLRRVQGRLSLTEKAGGECVFWREGAGCTVYEARPDQCRTFPFWRSSLASPESWSETARRCEGIGEGRVYEEREIVRLRDRRGATDPGEPGAGAPPADS